MPHSRKRDRLLVSADGCEDRWAGEHAVYLAGKLGARLSIPGIMNRHLLAFRGGIHYGNSTTELRWESRVAVDGVKKLAGPAARGGRQGPGRRGRALRMQSVDELRVERVTVREESAESRSQEDRRRIFLRLDGWDPWRAQLLSGRDRRLPGQGSSELGGGTRGRV